MKIEIKNRWNGEIILCGEYESITDCLKKNIGADLRGADLREADLREANLYGANLYGADLYEADLYGAKGIKLPIISISGSCHTLQCITGKIKIGCENHTVKKWLNDYKEIGKRNDYTPEQIAEYGEYIKMCAKFVKKAAPPSGKE